MTLCRVTLLVEAGKILTAAGDRSKMKFAQLQHGRGAYADEPWSLQAYQKRVYAVRDFYNRGWGIDTENPGYNEVTSGEEFLPVQSCV